MQGKEADYHDFVGIVVLLIINSSISFIEENNAGNAAAALMASLAPKAKVTLSLTIILYLLFTYYFFHFKLFTLIFNRSFMMVHGMKKMHQCWSQETLLVSNLAISFLQMHVFFYRTILWRWISHFFKNKRLSLWCWYIYMHVDLKLTLLFQILCAREGALRFRL